MIKENKKCNACKTISSEHSYEWEIIKSLLKTAKIRLLVIIVLLIFWLVSTTGFIWCLKENNELKKEVIIKNIPDTTIAYCTAELKPKTKRKATR